MTPNRPAFKRYAPPEEPKWVRPPFPLEGYPYLVTHGDHKRRTCRILLESPNGIRVVAQFEDGSKVEIARRSLRRRK